MATGPCLPNVVSLEEQIADIEEEITSTKYNKATQHHIGRLKAKLAKLRDETEKRASAKGGGSGYSVRKAGHATVALVGLPSVGKSTLLNRLTNAHSVIAAYEFTTLDVVPGILKYKGAEIQILDLPGLIAGASRGKGRGREVLSVVRSADLILMLLEPWRVEFQLLVHELESVGLRMNQKLPNGTIRSSDRGGINVISHMEQPDLELETIQTMLKEYSMVNADVVLREPFDQDRFLDLLTGDRIYTKGLIALTKSDAAEPKVLTEAHAALKKVAPTWPVVEISPLEKKGLPELQEAIYNTLGFIAIYLKPPGQEADLEEPLIIRKGATVGMVCDQLHRLFRKRFRYAAVSGPSSKFPGQTVGLNHVLAEGDILSLVIRR